MRNFINSTLIALIITLTTLTTCAFAQDLPSNEEVIEAIIDFQEEVKAMASLGGAWAQYPPNMDLIGTFPITDTRSVKVTEIFKKDNRYTLFGYPAHLRSDRNSGFYGPKVAKAYGTPIHFSIGPDGYMGTIVLAHEIAHSFGMGEEDADYFAASISYDLWDFAEYYLTNEESWSDHSKGSKDYLPAAQRLQLMAIMAFM